MDYCDSPLYPDATAAPFVKSARRSWKYGRGWGADDALHENRGSKASLEVLPVAPERNRPWVSHLRLQGTVVHV